MTICNLSGRCAFLVAAFSVGIAFAAATPPTTQPTPAVSEDGITIYFNPEDGAEGAIVDHINAAKQSVDVQCFHFTAEPLAAALIAAKGRGVNVRMIIDAKAVLEPKCKVAELIAKDIPVYVDSNYHTAHNKIMIFDGADVLTGSYNYTPQSAEENAENAVFIVGKREIAAAYVKNFLFHMGESTHITTAPAPSKAAKADD
jgi:phosphatidylserine/phosphatidylglycerophosphate/cardiolipin synthase-like enzyme